MINKIQSSNVSYTGRSYKFNREISELSEELISKGKKRIDKSIYDMNSDLFKGYAQIETKNVKLEKRAFGYAHKNSIELPEYSGPKSKHSGFSTETGGYGGGYLISDIHTPLSTTDIHTCAGLNLVDSTQGKQLLFHVYHNTTYKEIENFIKKLFPKFDRANIVPGDQLTTNSTVNNIISAVESVNPKAQKIFFHFGTETPEVVAHKGTLSYIQHQNSGNVTFKEVEQYYDINDFPQR